MEKAAKEVETSGSYVPLHRCGGSEERGAGHTGTGGTGTKRVQRDVMAGPGFNTAAEQLVEVCLHQALA